MFPILYHGSTSEKVVPTFGLGDDRMDELIAGPRNRAEKVMSTLV